MKMIFICLVISTLLACSPEPPKTAVSQPGTTPQATDMPKPPTVPTIIPEVIATFAHDTLAFTQGLTVWNGLMLESTGQYGASELRHVDLTTGHVKKTVKLGGQYFGEGSTTLKGKVYVITWLNQTAFVFDQHSLKKLGELSYSGEGWGLTTDGTELYMSNGTDVITVRNPDDFRVTRSIAVTLQGKPFRYLNELEWINGEIWANVWQSDVIVRIDPTSGTIKSMVDLTNIYPHTARRPMDDVLNGIAYNHSTKAIYVTGKNWPHLYQISVE